MQVRGFVVLAGCLTLALLAGCRQEGELSFPRFPPATARPIASADVVLGPMGQWLAGAAIPDSAPGAAQTRHMLQGLKSVKMRRYQLTPGGPAPVAQLAALRSQLTAPGWSPLLQTHDRDKGEDVGVYLAQHGEAIHGLAVVATSRTEVTIVNIVGTIQPEDVAALSSIAAEARKSGNIRWRTTEE